MSLPAWSSKAPRRTPFSFGQWCKLARTDPDRFLKEAAPYIDGPEMLSAVERFAEWNSTGKVPKRPDAALPSPRAERATA